jgi:hypothetical protein
VILDPATVPDPFSSAGDSDPFRSFAEVHIDHEAGRPTLASTTHARSRNITLKRTAEYIRPTERLWRNSPPRPVESARMKQLLIVACMIGCVYPAGTTDWWPKDQNQLLARRAAFDLNCDAAQIKVVPLGEGELKYKTVGVTGCGESATYRYNAYNLTWGQNRMSTVKGER